VRGHSDAGLAHGDHGCGGGQVLESAPLGQQIGLPGEEVRGVEVQLAQVTFGLGDLVLVPVPEGAPPSR